MNPINQKMERLVLQLFFLIAPLLTIYAHIAFMTEQVRLSLTYITAKFINILSNSWLVNIELGKDIAGVEFNLMTAITELFIWFALVIVYIFVYRPKLNKARTKMWSQNKKFSILCLLNTLLWSYGYISLILAVAVPVGALWWCVAVFSVSIICYLGLNIATLKEKR